MALLHIYDASDSRIRQTADARGAVHRLPIIDAGDLVPALDAMKDSGEYFDRVLFETHGSPGRIYFGNAYIDATWVRGLIPRGYTSLTTANARVYFNGCNVAEGDDGWSFLEAAVGVFLTPGGGEVFGQTSVGFGNPFNGHVVHLWGATRRLYVDPTGRIVERFEQ
jgi:hypothetical protein